MFRSRLGLNLSWKRQGDSGLEANTSTQNRNNLASAHPAGHPLNLDIIMSGTETCEFLVQASAGEPYVVSFRRGDANNVSAYCTCPAGETGMSCKHRIRILRGLAEGVISPNVADVTTVAGWFAGSDVETALENIAQLEREAERIQLALSAAKRALAKRLLD